MDEVLESCTDNCYFCDQAGAMYPCEGHMFCRTCMATLLSMSKNTGYSLDSLIAYFEPQRQVITDQRRYWNAAVEIIEENPEYVYQDEVYSE